MAGRASEEIFCQDITNGASNDIEKATELARQYVNTYGFSIDNKFMNSEEKDIYKNNLSNYLKDMSDSKVIEILNILYKNTLDLILNNKEKIELIANELLEKETIFYSDIRKIVD